MESSFQHSPGSPLGHSSTLHREQSDAVVSTYHAFFFRFQDFYLPYIDNKLQEKEQSDLTREIVYLKTNLQFKKFEFLLQNNCPIMFCLQMRKHQMFSSFWMQRIS